MRSMVVLLALLPQAGCGLVGFDIEEKIPEQQFYTEACKECLTIRT
jgi:hypothetical protein